MVSTVFLDYSFLYSLTFDITFITHNLYPEISFWAKYYVTPICVFVNSFIRQLFMRVYYVLGIIIGNRDKAINNTHKNSSLYGVYILAWSGEEIINKS